MRSKVRMYIPELYRNNHLGEVREFITANSFAVIVADTQTGLQATHIPLLLHRNKHGEDVLLGHISKANRQFESTTADQQVLVIFQGAHTYISSSWYDHENVPTWNYLAVHVYGKVRIIEGDELMQSLDLLVDKFEKNSAHPVSVKAMSHDFLQPHIMGITAFEIKIERIDAAKKLSQNRNDKNHERIVDKLNERHDENSHEIARQMRQSRERKNNL